MTHETLLDPRVLRRHRPQPEGALQERGERLVGRRLRQGRELEAGDALVDFGERAADGGGPGPEGVRGARRQRQRQRHAADVVLLHPPRQGLDGHLGAAEHYEGDS